MQRYPRLGETYGEVEHCTERVHIFVGGSMFESNQESGKSERLLKRMELKNPRRILLVHNQSTCIAVAAYR